MKTIVLAGCLVALVGAAVGLVSGLAGLFGGPAYGAVILGVLGFICGTINKARQVRYRDRAE